jgi:hypothetical protein
MGLDMYLYKRTYVKNWEFMDESQKHRISIEKDGKVREDIKPERITYITEEVAYWRKFNALHAWFVENCQDGIDNCKEHYVSKQQLEELLSTLKEIDSSNEISTAEKNLPTQSGFFFGGTEYDEYYFEEVKETIETLESLLSEENSDASYFYCSSW